jgi:hypothetical protein
VTEWFDILPDVPAERPYGLPEWSGGHRWGEDTHGRLCTNCGRRWAEVVSATNEYLRQRYFAHDGALVEHEQKEFVAEMDWLWSTIVDVAGGAIA